MEDTKQATVVTGAEMVEYTIPNARVADNPNMLALMNARYDLALRFAEAAAKSSFFSDVQTISQGAIKIMAGHELGLSEVTSLTSINVIKNRVSLSGELIAALLRQAGYSWKFGVHDDDGCELYCYYRSKPILNQDGSHATVTFTRADAEKAGLTERSGDKKSTYDKYGKDLFFNRCIVRMQRRFAPEVTKGIPVVTPDEAYEITGSERTSPAMPRRKQVEEEEA